MSNKELGYNENSKNLEEVNEKMSISYVTTVQENRIKINSTKDAYLIFTSLFAHEEKAFQDKEHLWVIAIDENDYACSAYVAALGLDNIEVLNAADLFRKAIKHDVKKIIIGHNQTKNTKLTADEHELHYTSKIYHKARLLDIELLDHIIINKESLTSQKPIYYSYRENSFMDFIAQEPTYQMVFEVRAEIEREKNDCREDGRDSKAKEITLNLLKNNIDLTTIAQYTTLSVNKVREIAEGGIE